MEQAQEIEKHVIWSNMNLDVEEWKPELEEEYPDRTDDEYSALMHEINNEYLDDEKMNLNIQLPTPIIPASNEPSGRASVHLANAARVKYLTACCGVFDSLRGFGAVERQEDGIRNY